MVFGMKLLFLPTKILLPMNCCKAYGIDLGTTNSVAAIYKAGKIEVLKSKFSDHFYPSVVSFPEKGKQSFLVGRIAKDKMKVKPREAVYNVKRLFGVEYNSEIVKTMQNTCSFKIEDDGNGKPVIAYTQNGVKNTKYPQEISAIVLSNIAADMKDFAGFDIKDVVITVPAYFNTHQRNLTKDAAKIAGLNVLEIITEPEAAAFAYMNLQFDTERIILLYDLGGGTFDVTIMRINGLKFEELALDGDLFLGGSDFDSLIMKAFIEDYETELHEKFPENRLSKLRFLCEAAKIDLMSHNETVVEFSDDFVWTLSKSRMDMLLQPLVKKTLDVCGRALASANLKPTDIDDLLFVGGSTYLKVVENMAPKYFGMDKPKFIISREESIAVGASKYALYLQDHKEGITHVSLANEEPKPDQAIVEEDLRMDAIPMIDIPDDIPPVAVIPDMQTNEKGEETDYVINTICSGTIGIADGARRFKKLITKGRRLPYFNSVELHNSEANMTELNITLLQGEHKHPGRNSVISRILISNIIPKPVGENTLFMLLDMDAHGSLSVRVIDDDTGKEMMIQDVFATMTEEELDNKRNALEEELRNNEMFERINEMKNALIIRINTSQRLHPEYEPQLEDLRDKIVQASSLEELQQYEAVLNQYNSFVCSTNMNTYYNLWVMEVEVCLVQDRIDR